MITLPRDPQDWSDRESRVAIILLLQVLRHWESSTNHANTRLSPSGHATKETARALLARLDAIQGG